MFYVRLKDIKPGMKIKLYGEMKFYDVEDTDKDIVYAKDPKGESVSVTEKDIEVILL